MAAARRLLLVLLPLAAQAFLMPSARTAGSLVTAPHRPTVGRSAAVVERRPARLSMMLGGAEPELAGAMLEPTAAAASVAFLSTLLNVAEETTYSKASYYTTLALYILSFPGLISLVTRSVKSKDVKRTFVAPGPKAKDGLAKEPRLVAGEVMAYFTRLGYSVADNAGGKVTFKGVIGRSKSQAFFLVFCTFLGMVSLALVLSIQFQEIGQNWFYITLLSPYAGVYYWQRASREDTVQVKLETTDDEESTEIVAIGNKEELERMATTLNYGEKGMVRVQGIFEAAPAAAATEGGAPPPPPSQP